MKWLCLWAAAGWLALAAPAAELKFDFAGTLVGETPKGFRSLVVGQGAPGQWQIVRDAGPDAERLAPTGSAAAGTRPVLGQLSRVKGEERFPVLLYDGESFEDFTFRVRFKVVGGEEEQMAGIVFRAQDEKNMYVLRANAKDGNVRFYAVVDGRRTPPVGNNVPVPLNQWHELKVEAKGNRFVCSFNGQPLGNFITDNTFKSGKLGFWTMSDSVSYFAEAVVSYTPREALADQILRDTMKKYPRLLGLQICATPPGQTEPQVIASTHPKDRGQPGGKTVADILARGTIYHQWGKEDATVFMPLRDRNGDVVAVARVTLDTFWGQTEKNLLARALPIVKYMQSRIHAHKDLFE